MAKKPYEPDDFDRLGSGPIPGGLGEKDREKWDFWQARGIPSESMADRLEAEAKLAKMGWGCTYGRGTDRHGKPFIGRVLHPLTKAKADEWEASNVALREQQEAELPAFMAEHAPPKPTEQSAGGNFTLKVTPNAPDPRIPKYEDSAESHALRRAARELKRS